MISSISSPANEKIKALYKQTRDFKNHYFVIESINIIKEFTKQNKNIDTILLTQDFLDKNSWIRFHQNIIVVNRNIVDKLSFTINSPDCIGIYKYEIPYFKLDVKSNYLILDNLKDPGNLATIIRSSIAFGIDKIFISKHSVTPYNDKVFRSSMGTIFDIKINYYDNLINLVNELEKNNIECIASCIDTKAIKLDQYKPKQKHWAIILGNESNGLDKNDLSKIKNKVFIDIKNTNSLNVASATSILLYQSSLWNKK